MNELNKLALSAFACTAFLASLNSPGLARPDQAQKYTVTTKTGQPEIHLRFMPRDVVRIESDFKYNRKAPKKRFSGYLLKIDDNLIKGKTRTQIRDLFSGPVYSMVKITYLDRAFKPQEIIMPRVSPELRHKPSETSLDYIRDFSRFLTMDSSICHATDFFHFGRSLVQDDLDMLVVITARSSIRAVKNISPPNDALLCYHAADAAMLLDSIGDMDRADKYLAMVVNNPKFTKRRLESVFRRKFLEHLLSTGREEEFKTISAVLEKELDREDIDTRSDGLNRWSFSRLQLEYLIPRKREDATRLALAMEKEKGRWGERTYLDAEWLGDRLEDLGLTENALDCYRKLEPHKQLSQMLSRNRNIKITSAYDFQALRISQLEDKIGNTSAAEATLESLLKIHDQYFSHQDEVLIEQLPIYFPARSDLEIQLALYKFKQKEYNQARQLSRSIKKRMEEAKAESAQSHILKALLDPDARSKADEIANLKLVVPGSSTEKQNIGVYKLIRAALNKINDRKYAEADKTVEKLKRAYLDFVPVNIYQNSSPNMFCALLNISRKLADKGEFKRSNQILSFLESSLEKEAEPKAFSFLLAEQTLNAVNETSDNTKWELLNRDNPLKVKSNLDYLPKRIKLKKQILSSAMAMDNARLVGQVYCAAGDMKRSKQFIEHALNLEEQIADESDVETQKKKTLLFLDAAIFYSKMKNVRKSEKHFAKAQTLRETIPVGDIKTNIPDGGFAGACNYKSAELAGCLASINETAKAIKMLKEVLSLLKKDKVAENFDPRNVRIRSKVHQILTGHAAVKSQLANLLFQIKDIKQANEYIASATYDVRNDSSPLFLWLLAGEIAVANEDNAAAAHYYSEAEKVIDYPIPVSETQPGYREMLLENASRYADGAIDLNDSEKANIYLRLGKYYKETKPERTWELYKKAYKYISDFEPKKAELSKQIAELGKQTASLREERGTSQSKKNNSAFVRDRISDLKRAAKLAEKSKRPDAYSFWIVLAAEQANQNYCDDALKSAYHGLLLYGKLSQTKRPGVPVTYRGVPSALVDRGMAKEAEKILKDSLNAVNTKYSEQSYIAAEQLVQLYVFYVETDQQKLALDTLAQILKFKQRELETVGSNSALQTILNYARNPAGNKDNNFIKNTLIRVLEVQKKQLPSNDFRISNTLIALAEVEKSLSLFKQADDRLQQATAIKSLFLGNERAIVDIFRYRKPCLAKLGKTDELKKLEQLTKNRTYCHRRRKQPGKALTFIQRLQFRLDGERKYAPYSTQTANALEDLARNREREKDWKVVLDAMKERIDIYERSEDKYAGRLGGCTRPSFYRYEFYTLAAIAEYNLHKSNDAIKWIERAVEIVPSLSSHELLEISSTAAEIGDMKLATKLAHASEEAMKSDDSWNYHLLSKVWKKIGDNRRAGDFENKSIKARERTHKMYKQMEKSPFDGFSP